MLFCGSLGGDFLEGFAYLLKSSFSILDERIYVFGFDFTLMEMAIWSTVAFFLFWFMYSFFK